MIQTGLHLRRRRHRSTIRAGEGQDHRRRQGRQPRRNGRDRPAGAAGLHHHHRGMRPLSGGRRRLSRRRCARSRRGAGAYRARGRQALRRCGRSAAGLGPLGRAGVDAGDDGHRAQPRAQRRDGRGPRQRQRRRALRVGQLPPLHPDVFGRRARHRSRPVRGSARNRQGRQGLLRRYRDGGGRLAGAGRASTSASSRASSAAPFPQDVHEQLWGAIAAVFDSWDSDRAKVYRRLNDIPADWGTAVNVQAMVFGNMGETSATGVAFTRDPATGEQRLLRRMAGQRAGRGRRRRHPHAAVPDRAPRASAPGPSR